MIEELSDKAGKDTLDAIAIADRFNEWMYKTIEPFSKGKILEIGSGIGNISDFFLNNDYDITLSDLRPEYCHILSRKYHNQNDNINIIQLDLVHQDFSFRYKNEFGRYDTVFALNVIEHIEDDTLAIHNAKKFLKDGGNLIILAPSYQALYNNFDIELGHFRRYTRKSLAELLLRNNLEMIHQQNFNFIGMFGWFISSRILRRKNIPKAQMKFFNLMVPFWKLLDRIINFQIGLSTLVIGKNKWQ